MLILLSSPVLGKQNVIVENVQTGGLLNIEYLKFFYVPTGENLQFNIHVYNSTGFLLDDTTTSCYIHFYNNSGHHLLETELLFNDEDFFAENFTFTATPGGYSYITWCNSTTEGGFVSNIFEVVEDLDQPVRSDLIPLAIILGSLLFGMIYIYCAINLRVEQISKTRVVEKIILYFTGLLISLSGYFLMIVEVSNNSNFTYFKSTLITIFTILILVFLAILALFAYHTLETTMKGSEDDEDY